MIATLGPAGSDVLFFTYDASGGFTQTGSLSLAGWQTSVCGHITFDSHRNLYLSCDDFTAQSSHVLVFASGSMNDAQPIRVLLGAAPFAVGSAVDSKGNVYVCSTGIDGGEGTVAVFAPDSDSTPIRVLQGSSTGLLDPTAIAIDAKDDLYVGTGGPVEEFAPGATGDVVPTPIAATSSCPTPGETMGVAFDPAGRTYFACGGEDAEIEVVSNGTVVRSLGGPTTGIDQTGAPAIDSTGRLFVGSLHFRGGVDPVTGPDGLYVFGADASGDAAPEAVLTTVSGATVGIAP
jgi:hypothetical protein